MGPRIIIASPHVQECSVLAEWLSAAGFEAIRATNVVRATEEMQTRGFDLLVADFTFAFRHGLHAVVSSRVRSASTSMIVIGEVDAGAEAQAGARGAMYLARPVDREALSCLVAMAVMENRPVRRSVRKAVSRLDAFVDGAPAHILDVSNEGMRLEIPRGRKSAPPPFFTVRVPMIGVDLVVRRMWTTGLQSGVRDAAVYGGQLSRNPARAELAWRRFVDAIPSSGAVLEVQ